MTAVFDLSSLEAGGHVRGERAMLGLLEQVRKRVTVPILAAGGIVDQRGVRETTDIRPAAELVRLLTP